MKLHKIVLASYAACASGAKLVSRQGTCSTDNCFRAVWGTDRGPDAPLSALRDCMSHLTTTIATYTYSVATITIVARTTATAVVSCSTTLPSKSSSTASSLPGFSFSTPSPTPAEIAGKLKVRQNEVLSTSTTTIIGPIPTYAGEPCSNSDVFYASACSCKNLTSSIINVNGPRTTLTSTDTLTLTSTVTSTASCSLLTVITLSHSSSTMVTTVTLTPSTGTGTGTGTVSSQSSSSATSSSSETFNTTITSSSTLSSATTTTFYNTTLTSPTTPTPTCATPGWILCNSTCLNPASDKANCGSCGNKCGDGLVCFNGVCARRPLDPPCDTNCTFRRECNQGLSRVSCSCARDSDGFGICFDANMYQCLSDTPKCKATTGCRLGEICVKSICAASSSCSNTTVPEAEQDGICVTSLGCGRQGPTDFGALVRIREHQQRKRMVGEFNW
ncbi:uncharacterized protein M421DRAFT_91243 [Didymella exigua CBS 183.55]|uniref:Uncharacterized protein n=1 Tax=Didymella exigua CBS 183.55 TaxID=1150837 RepID=A0A6A5RUR7_9PLEO|nr:uncharacterized protein M421DRAFT_91243 [Didymella exigua CBS 183.55]KAF1930046.1 hypothetical protein M421DRAFT_91243 [Didymella exigua CBS 183.55]